MEHARQHGSRKHELVRDTIASHVGRRKASVLSADNSDTSGATLHYALVHFTLCVEDRAIGIETLSAGGVHTPLGQSPGPAVGAAVDDGTHTSDVHFPANTTAGSRRGESSGSMAGCPFSVKSPSWMPRAVCTRLHTCRTYASIVPVG